jgi:competence protein ComEC
MRKRVYQGAILILIVVGITTRVLQSKHNTPNIQNGNNVRVKIKVETIKKPNISKQVINGDDWEITLAPNVKVGEGDTLILSGKVQVKVISIFDTKYIMKYPSILGIQSQKQKGIINIFNPNNFWSVTTYVQQALAQKLAQHLPEPHTSLLAGILLGIRATMPGRFYQNLVDTGTLHIIAASGYNITIVANSILALLSLALSRRQAIFFALLGVVGYTIVAGASPPVIRAALMGAIMLAAQYAGRQYNVSFSLILATALMIFFQPLLLTSVSFWLSISATAGILILSPQISNYLKTIAFQGRELSCVNQSIRSKITVSLVDNFATTCSAYLSTTPIIILVFQRISLISLLANMLVLWLIPAIMALGAVLLVLELVLPSLASLVAVFVWVPLEVFVRSINLLAIPTYASIDIGQQYGWVGGWLKATCILGYYLVLLLITFHLKRKNSNSNIWDMLSN